jgi:hypothetical protein
MAVTLGDRFCDARIDRSFALLENIETSIIIYELRKLRYISERSERDPGGPITQA